MAEPTSTTEHIFRLSSIDQSLTRKYIRYGLCFAHTRTDIEATTSRLNATVRRTVTHLPILAGTVRPEIRDDSTQLGRLEVAVTLQDLANFKPSFKEIDMIEFPYTYEDLANARMPASALASDKFTPLPDNPDTPASAVFALQANFITGGLIVALYLHQSVADIVGIRTIIAHLSSDLPTCKLTCEDLKDEALEQSRLRDRLSGSRGVKSDLAAAMRPEDTSAQSTEELLQSLSLTTNSNTARVFSFDLNLVEGTTAILNERFHYIHGDRSVALTSFDTIVAILWKGTTRARPAAVDQNEQQQSERTSTISIPVDIRKRIDPALDDSFFGNATVQSLATSGIIVLSVPYEVGSLAHTTRLIRTTTSMMSEQRVRSTIASINESTNVQSTPTMKINPKTDLVITNWAYLSLDEADLGLGLGHPDWVRKLGRLNGISECTIHAPRKEAGVWEVAVELEQPDMAALLTDEGFMSFVVAVA